MSGDAGIPTRAEALADLDKYVGGATKGDYVGPGVEAVAALLRDGQTISDNDLDAALTLLLEYVAEVQRLIIGAAREKTGPNTWRMGWWDVGARLGFPGGTASMRAIKLARKIGLMPPATPRSPSDQDDDDGDEVVD